jgi:FAD/FMN-containing dehydrogenase
VSSPLRARRATTWRADRRSPTSSTRGHERWCSAATRSTSRTRTLPAGCGATVGIAGLALGGGLGILGRRHGLTCDWLRGAEVVLADGRVVECDEERLEDLFWPLRGAGGGQAAFSKSQFFRSPLPAQAVAALVGHLASDRVAGQGRELDFIPWGAAYNRVPADATAFAHRDALFLLKHSVVVEPDVPPAEREAARRWLRQSWSAVQRWGSGGAYVNFPDPDLEDRARAYHGGNYERLRRVKRRYDPDGVFRFPQSVEPADQPHRRSGHGRLLRVDSVS